MEEEVTVAEINGALRISRSQPAAVPPLLLEYGSIFGAVKDRLQHGGWASPCGVPLGLSVKTSRPRFVLASSALTRRVAEGILDAHPPSL